jgi:hypothetical protein
MNHPDREDTLVLLGEWQAHAAAVEKMMTGIKTSIGLEIGGPLFDTVWGIFNAYTSALAVEVGDLGQWLEWYSAENEMGARGMEAGYDGQTTPIKTLDDLYELIAESRKRVQS